MGLKAFNIDIDLEEYHSSVTEANFSPKRRYRCNQTNVLPYIILQIISYFQRHVLEFPPTEYMGYPKCLVQEWN